VPRLNPKELARDLPEEAVLEDRLWLVSRRDRYHSIMAVCVCMYKSPSFFFHFEILSAVVSRTSFAFHLLILFAIVSSISFSFHLILSVIVSSTSFAFHLLDSICDRL
jgi:hypothetical protein